MFKFLRNKNILFKMETKDISTKNKVIYFCSGNAKKFEEVCDILQKELPDVEVRQLKADLPELQGEPESIVLDKLKNAIDKYDGPLMVEDTSLCYNAFKGLPGPYIKDFLSKLGNDGLYKLLDGFEDKTAYAQCIFGMKRDKNDDAKVFVGRTHGSIVKPRGPNNFGWDTNFQPDGFDQTYAEMDKDVKNKISHRYKALKQLIEYLKENSDSLI
jgi:inosine triphosphate pyrophosphatase